jgi:hypothetical protein
MIPANLAMADAAMADADYFTMKPAAVAAAALPKGIIASWINGCF